MHMCIQRKRGGANVTPFQLTGLGVQRGSQTKPVLNFYKKKVANISANKPMADVEKQIKAAMGSL